MLRKLRECMLYAALFLSACNSDGGNNNVNPSVNAPKINNAPIVKTINLPDATQDQKYSLKIEAEDNDNDKLSYSLTQKHSWLNIDQNGLLTGTPANSDVGTSNLEVKVSDGKEEVKKQFSLNILNVNDHPMVQDIPQLSAVQDQQFQHQIQSTDLDNDILAYQVIKPSWIIVSSAGLLNGTPANNNVGLNDLEIKVTDGKITITKTSKINVANVNDKPVIQTASLNNATQGQLYAFQITALDIDGDKLTFELIKKPDWLNIDKDTGQMTGTPANSNVGLNDLEVKVTDGALSDAKNYTLSVANVNDAPQITSAPITAVAEGGNYSYQVTAQDIDVSDVLSFFLTTNTSQNAINAGLSINSTTGLISWNNVPSGNYNIELLVRDADGAEAKQNFPLIINNTVHNITGKVTDTEGNGLAGIIINMNSTQAAISDFQGNYLINGLPTGNYSLVAGDNFSTVFNYVETINLTDDAAKTILLIKKLAVLTIHNDYKNSMGNPSLLEFLKKMTDTKQSSAFDRWKDSNLPVKIYLNQQDAESSAPGYDKVTYDQNTGNIIGNAPNGVNDYLDFGRRAIKKWNEAIGIDLFQETNTPIGVNGVGIDFEYTSNTVIPNAEGVTVKDVISLTDGFQYLRVQITDNHKIPVYDLSGNIIGYVYKDFSGTILHELGHCLGLLHSQDTIHLMYLDGTGGQTTNGQEIHQDEINIVRIIYQLPFKADMAKYQDQ